MSKRERQAEYERLKPINDANLKLQQERLADALAEQARTEERIRQSQALRRKTSP